MIKYCPLMISNGNKECVMNKKIVGFFVVLFLVVSSGVVVTWAQTGGGYDLAWHTIDGGGGLSSGGSYSAKSTIGQPDVDAMSGGDYNLQGGFWPGAIKSQPHEDMFWVYLPTIIK
jgi:hypothetical protein